MIIYQVTCSTLSEHNIRSIYDKLAKTVAQDIAPKVITDKAPEIQSRIKDIQDNLKVMY